MTNDPLHSCDFFYLYLLVRAVRHPNNHETGGRRPQESCGLKLDQTSWKRLALQIDPVLQEPWIQVNVQRTRKNLRIFGGAFHDRRKFRSETSDNMDR